MLPSAPYGASPATNSLNPVQPGAVNPQTPLLPPGMQVPLPNTGGAPGQAGQTLGVKPMPKPVSTGGLLGGLFG